MSSRFPGRRLSIWRLSGVLVVVAALLFSAFQGWRWFQDSTSVTGSPWMAGYVDVTATPAYAFENPTSPAGHNVVLSFVVASKQDDCEPSWGTYYSMPEADKELDLDRRIARLDQQGGEVIVSFGGQLNDELATACTDSDALESAYSAVIDRYSLSTIDLDIEGANLRDGEAGERRAKAIAAIQEDRSDTDNPLAVWATLPVTPGGLPPEATDAVTQLLVAGVDLAGVNLMTMNYGASRTVGQSMADATRAALEATHRQLDTLYKRQGIELGTRELWNKIGVTPMVGQNDVPGEIVTLEDAKAVNAFALSHGVGRMSLWSLNRDTTCGSNYPDITVVSDSCSGVEQGDQTYAQLLGASFTGTPEDSASAVTTSRPTPEARDLVDDPATSPYEIWSPDVPYSKDSKVVWHRQVYRAKYWTEGDLPDNPVLQASETPWELIGPVLPGETPLPSPTVPEGIYAEWQGPSVYTKGDRVMFEGKPYEAKWWTQGDSPQAAAVDRYASPWRKLTDDEIRSVIAATQPGAASAG